MFLDLAYLVRKLLCEQGLDDAEIVGLVLSARRTADPAP